MVGDKRIRLRQRSLSATVHRWGMTSYIIPGISIQLISWTFGLFFFGDSACPRIEGKKKAFRNLLTRSFAMSIFNIKMTCSNRHRGDRHVDPIYLGAVSNCSRSVSVLFLKIYIIVLSWDSLILKHPNFMILGAFDAVFMPLFTY